MDLLETNIYDAKGKVLICGTCLPRMQKDAYKKLEKEFDTILYLCLEKEHINMAITKICGMISTKKIEKLTFASVNKSPHCTQLHYIKHEIERVMKTPKIDNIIIENNEIYKISDETIKLSKNLIKLEEKIKSIRECSC
jgi:hypothetical protein